VREVRLTYRQIPIKKHILPPIKESIFKTEFLKKQNTIKYVLLKENIMADSVFLTKIFLNIWPFSFWIKSNTI